MVKHAIQNVNGIENTKQQPAGYFPTKTYYPVRTVRKGNSIFDFLPWHDGNTSDSSQLCLPKANN